MDVPSFYSDKGIDPATWKQEQFEVSTGYSDIIGSGPVPDGMGSWLLAWDPVGQKEAWRVRQPGLWPGGTLTTQGNLVFQGRGDGNFVAYDARTGAVLWQFDAGIGIDAPPITYSLEGKQYVSVLVGWGGEGSFGSFGPLGIHWSYRSGGRRLLTFALGGNAPFMRVDARPERPRDVAGLALDEATVQRGYGLYHDKCSICHGVAAVAGGAAPDLRASPVALSADGLRSVALEGALQRRGMPKFARLSREELDAIYQYIRFEARQSLAAESGAATH
jgi:quinohemoprotein ethanol dehydrogenase